MPGRTVLDITNAALQELGLPKVLTIMSETGDRTSFQLAGLLSSLGAQLVKVHDWQFLEKNLELVGDGTTNQFNLPDDFGRQVNQTQWASKDRRPMAGPVTPQGWSWIQHGIVSDLAHYRYRILGNKVVVHPTPAAGEKFYMYYISNKWLVNEPVGFPAVFRSSIEQDDDTPLFDFNLMVAGAKYRIWAAKGMDTTALLQEFNYMLSAEKGQTQGASVISLDRRPYDILLNTNNLPDGGWNV